MWGFLALDKGTLSGIVSMHLEKGRRQTSEINSFIEALKEDLGAALKDW